MSREFEEMKTQGTAGEVTVNSKEDFVQEFSLRPIEQY
jgi:hypothetical protein